MVNKHTKDVLPSRASIIREMQIKITLRYHVTLIRIAKIRNLKITKTDHTKSVSMSSNWNAHKFLARM